jgi:carbonic anhydrase
MKFCAAINCMDGRVQLPVINYSKERFKVSYVDSITEPGPNLILAKQSDKVAIQSIILRVKISVEKHKSVGIAIVGHYDCSGNPSVKEDQLIHLKDSIGYLRQYFDIEIIALWVDENWKVNEI